MKRRLYIITGVILAVVTLLIFFGYGTIVKPFGDLFTLILRPLQGKSFPAAQAINDYLARHDKVNDLVAENENIKNDLEKLRIENSRLRSEIKDLNIIRAEQEFLDNQGYTYVTARAIGRTSDNILEEIIINVGKKEGVSDGLAVVSKQGYIIGKVVETRETISKVLLITDSRSEIAAEVQNETGAPGLIVSHLGLSLIMDLIPQNEIIQSDQMIITSGLESNIPKGLVIGRIGSVAQNPGDIFKQAAVITDLDYRRIDIVSVIIGQK
ncbi:MAG: rod shape-determining protein MreC [Patescibacteria group bacterium]|nr:rod shape-determining protein MreC [Patescibacteria group bacterium]